MPNRTRFDGTAAAQRSIQAFCKQNGMVKAGITLFALSIVNAVAFNIWRWDKPLNNPGGPLAGMGFWPLAWEVSSTTLFSLASALCLVGKMRSQAHRPPPSS